MVEGELITPRLRLVRALGPEGKTHVWLAEHAGLGRKVAVKLMGRTLSRNSSPLHRFQREAEVAGKHLKSPYFAQVLEHGLTRTGMPYLVTEFQEGEDLGVRVLRDGPMQPKEVARLVSQLAKGLAKAHQLGLVHRNLKPGNVFLVTGEDGEVDVKVLDLGLSVRAGISSMGRTTSDAAHMVAPEFLSPEQIFGLKDVDFRADLWAIGVVAYFALTGRVPFSEKNIDQFATAIEEGRFAPPSTLVPGLSPAVDTFFAKALQRDPAARFTGTAELAESLERALMGELEERTSRTSHPHASARPTQTGGTTGSMRRPFMVSEKEISERIPASIRDAALHLHAPDGAMVTASQRAEKRSSALVIIALAIAGIGAIFAGLALLSGGGAAPHGPPQLPAHSSVKR